MKICKDHLDVIVTYLIGDCPLCGLEKENQILYDEIDGFRDEIEELKLSLDKAKYELQEPGFQKD